MTNQDMPAAGREDDAMIYADWLRAAAGWCSNPGTLDQGISKIQEIADELDAERAGREDDAALDLDAIEARAKLADPGPWEYRNNGVPVVLGPSSNPSIPSPVVATTRYSDRLMPNDCANMDHIAGMDPEKTLALVALARRACAPASWPYQKTFDAIAAATRIEGDNIAISVKAFAKSFDVAPAPQPDAEHHRLKRPASDIVARLRAYRVLADRGGISSEVADPLMIEAADEIERLMKKQDTLNEAIDCHNSEEEGWEHDFLQERARAERAEAEIERLTRSGAGEVTVHRDVINDLLTAWERCPAWCVGEFRVGCDNLRAALAAAPPRPDAMETPQQLLQKAEALLHDVDGDHAGWARALLHQAAAHLSDSDEIRRRAAEETPRMLDALRGVAQRTPPAKPDERGQRWFMGGWTRIGLFRINLEDGRRVAWFDSAEDAQSAVDACATIAELRAENERLRVAFTPAAATEKTIASLGTLLRSNGWQRYEALCICPRCESAKPASFHERSGVVVCEACGEVCAFTPPAAADGGRDG